MPRRIICSDDEDEGENSHIASSSKNSKEVTDLSGTEMIVAMHGQTKHKVDHDEDGADVSDDDGDEDYVDEGSSKSSVRHGGASTSKKRFSLGFRDVKRDNGKDSLPRTAPHSTRSRESARSGSSTKEVRRREQLRELSSRLGKGLEGALSSDEDSFIATDDDDVFLTSKKRKNKSRSQDRYTFSAARDINAGSVNRTPSVQSFFKGARGDNDPTPRTRKARTPEPSSGEEDDVADFILNSEEEREEEEERLLALEKQRQKEKKKRRKEKEARRLARETEGPSSKTNLKEHASSSTKKRIIQDDEDEVVIIRSYRKNKTRIYVDDEEEEEEGNTKASSAKKRRIPGDEVEDENEDDGKNEEESNDESASGSDGSDSDDDDDDEGAADGPLLYWQVDAMREQDQDANPDAMPIRKNFSLQEALRLYIEMLANAHVDAAFLSKLARSPNSSPNSSYIAAARQIENKICVYRESMVGSGAWNVTFATELNKRPFYICSPSSFHGEYGEKCSACNRTSTGTCKQIYLFGIQYNAQSVWNSTRWDRDMPSDAFFHSRYTAKQDDAVELSSSNDESSDNSDDEGESDDGIGPDNSKHRAAQACEWWKRKWPGALTSGKESRWMLSGHCCNRTQLYHTLLHYKLRLFLKVREKLERVGGSVGEAMRDSSFVGNEVTRYESLLKTTERLYGGRGMESSSFESDCWHDDADATPIPSSGRSSSSRHYNEDGGQSGGMLQWLQKGQTQDLKS